MLNGASLIAICALSLVVIRSCLALKKRTKRLPRVGRAGPIGYALCVLRSILDSDGLVAEGWDKFGGKPFILPSMTGEWIVLGPEFVELLRKSDDTVVSGVLPL